MNTGNPPELPKTKVIPGNPLEEAVVVPEIIVSERANVTPDDVLAEAQAIGMSLTDEEARLHADQLNQMVIENPQVKKITAKDLLAAGMELVRAGKDTGPETLTVPPLPGQRSRTAFLGPDSSETSQNSR